MNTQFSQQIKKTTDKSDSRTLLLGNTPCVGEVKLANGDHTKFFLYLFFLGNAFVYGARKNLLNNKIYTVMAIFATYPLAKITSHYVFGYEELRRINNSYNNTKESLELYEKLAAKKA